MKFLLLGPLEVIDDDGRSVDLGRPQERAVLALLLLSLNRVVPLAAIVEGLWGERPPTTAANVVQGYVSRLRRALAPGARIQTVAPGYRLEAEPDALDLVRFERGAAEGRRALGGGEATLAAGLLEESMALYRGAPLAEFCDWPFARAEATRWERLLRTARADWATARLELGQHDELVPELERLVADDRFNERLYAVLMTALYRAGRQAEALAAYQRVRRTLVEELGVEPGPELRRLEVEVLRQELAGPRLLPGPPRLAGAGPAALPARLTSFVGREQELADVVRVLAGARLVTLIGPGGCGKTSLAVEAVRPEARRFPDGVWFVDLAPLAADALVPAAMAGALGLRQEPGRPLADTVSEYLSSRHALVVLDNCEHRADAAGALVDRLLRAAPAVRVLATSRQRLGVPGETAWTVPPLAEPDAVRLFVERARSVAPTVSVEGDPAVIEVCRRLDGVPLAIELAAARTSVLPVCQIARRLDDALRLLGEASRTVPPRQRTLRATIEWSYELLSETERTLFDRLAVFAGGFTLEAAEAVGTSPELAAPEVLDCFARLAAKSLVLREIGEDGTVRFRLLETLRQYGASRLVAEDRLAGVQAAHAAYYLDLAEKEAPGLYRPGSGDCLRRLTSEEANLRAALEWSLAEPPGVESGRAETGCRLVIALHWSWFVEGRIAEGRSWADAALAATEGQQTFLRGWLSQTAALLASAHSDIAAIRAHGEEAARLGAELGSPVLRAVGANFLAIVRWAEGDLARAGALMNDAIEDYQLVGQDPHLPVESAIADGYWGPWHVIIGLTLLGRFLNDAGRISEASEALSRARGLARVLGEDMALGFALDVSATIALDRGDSAEAASLIEEAVHHYRRTGWLEGLASGLNTKGLVALSSGAAATAQASFGEALGLCRRLGHLGGLAAALEGVASVAADGDQAHHPATLLGAAAALRARSGAGLPAHLQPAHRRLRAELAGRLGDDEFATAWKAGEALGPDAAVELAGRAGAFSERPVDT